MGSLFFIIDLVVADIYVVHIRGVIVLRTDLQTETVTIQLISLIHILHVRTKSYEK